MKSFCVHSFCFIFIFCQYITSFKHSNHFLHPNVFSLSKQCEFNKQCTCCNKCVHSDQVNVVCNVSDTFPDFSNFTSVYEGTTITSGAFDITGNFSTIPANAFPFPVGRVDIIRYGNVSVQNDIALDIDEFAFSSFVLNRGSVNFVNIYIPTFPTLAFSGKQNISDIRFLSGKIGLIPNSAFNGWIFDTNSSAIEFSGNNLNSIDVDAFAGLQISSKFKFSASHNQLQVISPAFSKLTFIDTLDLTLNEIRNVTDFIFCPPNSSYPNILLSKLLLDSNPLVTLSTNIFACLPSLQHLSIKNASLMQIPDALKMVASTLTVLDLSYNNLVKIAANTFYEIHLLESLYLNNNPITDIELGAFNGLNHIRLLQMKFIDVVSVDLLITFGMNNITSIGFVNCNNLESIFVSDPTKLPLSLKDIGFDKNPNLKTVDVGVASWLNISNTNFMILQNSGVFECNDNVGWMTPYVFCQPYQISVANVFCVNSGFTLQYYLANYQPFQCS